MIILENLRALVPSWQKNYSHQGSNLPASPSHSRFGRARPARQGLKEFTKMPEIIKDDYFKFVKALNPL